MHFHSTPLLAAATTLLALACSTPAHAAFLDLPPILVEQSNSGRAHLINNTPRTYLMYFDETLFAGQLAGPVLITGFQTRLALGNRWRHPDYVGNTWPAVNLTMPRYDVWMGRASSTLASANWLSPLFQANGQPVPSFASLMSDARRVRSEGLTILSGSYQATGGSTGVHAWGPTITFSTPYLYTPGQTLTLLIRNDGMLETDFLGALMASRYNANGYVDAAIQFDANATHPVGLADPQYVRFTTAPIPEPAALTLLPATALLATRRRPKH